ncbi:MAG: hypothetical protein ABJL72_11750 [Roseobacter sp.]
MSVAQAKRDEQKMRIAFLHTADVHVATFERIFEDLDGDIQQDHHVDADLLERARQGGIEVVRSDVLAILKKLSAADAVLCTCSTLGPLVDEASVAYGNIIRIDRPLMEQACRDGEKILVALCLTSTRDATLDLLLDCAKTMAQDIKPVLVQCAEAWSFFEAGDMAGYARSISHSINERLSMEEHIDCIVLAQASMRVAESELEQTGIPIRSSPELAAHKVLQLARATGVKKDD